MKKPRTYETTVVDAFEDAASEVENLAEEMRSWYDNMPENFQNGERGERVGEAADTLENAELRRPVEELTSLLSRLSEGTPAKEGCAFHLEGKKCKVCGWDGYNRAQAFPIYFEEEDPKPTKVTYYGAKKPTWETRVAGYKTYGTTIFQISRDDDTPPTPEEIEAERVAARRDWWKEAEKIENWNEANAIPKLRPFEPAVEPLEGLEEKFDAVKVTLPVGGKRPSRADRLANATNAITTAIEALREFVAAEPMLAPYAEDIEGCVSEIEDALGELEGVEFPGMYG